MTPEQVERLIAAAEKIGDALAVIAYRQQHPGSTVVRYSPVSPNGGLAKPNDGYGGEGNPDRPGYSR
jgi:hypothetical protein